MCLTDEIGNFNHLIIAFISSKTNTEILESDFIIKFDHSSGTGLKVDSIIKLHKIVTIPKSLIKRKLGFLSLSQIEIVENKLEELFSLKKSNL